MLILGPQFLLRLQSAIVEASHGLTTPDGSRGSISTINAGQLRQAALVAVQIATGETIWPGDERLVIHRQRQAVGPFEIVEN